jgi:hypothetical protein
VEKVLEDAQIKLSTVATDIFGVSGRAMLSMLISGQRDPRVLADLALGRLANKHAELIEQLIRANLPTDAQVMARLCEIPGIGERTAQAILAEIGFDMAVFPSPGHLASWAKLTPRTIQSGARATHGPTGKGNRWLKGALGQATFAASRTKNTFLGTYYRRLVKRMPRKKALTALARKILEIIWHLLSDPRTRYAERNRLLRQAARPRTRDPKGHQNPRTSTTDSASGRNRHHDRRPGITHARPTPAHTPPEAPRSTRSTGQRAIPHARTHDGRVHFPVRPPGPAVLRAVEVIRSHTARSCAWCQRSRNSPLRA